MSPHRAGLRKSLWPLSCVYAGVAALRNRMFDAGWKAVHGVDVPVISVGNLTVGGTGKTPLVAWLVDRARALGRRPGVLARGYGRAPGAALNDEGMLLAARFPGLPQVQDPDRVAGARRLIAEHRVDLVVLDDGFQHRRLARDVDVVCVDARDPFAGFRVLPAGDLREPVAGLGRADVVVMTRADALDAAARDACRDAIRRHARRAELPVLAARHAVRDLVMRPSGAVEPAAVLAGRRVHLLSGIARPAAFEATLVTAGAVVARHVARADHHRHTAAEVDATLAAARDDGALLVTTEKDAVKLSPDAGPLAVLRIDLVFLGDHAPDAVLGLTAPCNVSPAS